MTEEQLRVRDYILDKEELPPEYGAVIINKSNETAINIRGRVDYIIVHSQEDDVREQVRGRYRGDLDKKHYFLAGKRKRRKRHEVPFSTNTL